MATALAKGTVVQVETVEGSGVYTTIPKQTNLTGPQLTSTEHNISSHDTVGLVMEFLAGMIDPGSMNFQLFEDVTLASHRQIDADKLSLLERNYRKVWAPSGYYRTLRAYVKDYNPSHGVDAPHTASVQLRCVGLPGAITAP